MLYLVVLGNSEGLRNEILEDTIKEAIKQIGNQKTTLICVDSNANLRDKLIHFSRTLGLPLMRSLNKEVIACLLNKRFAKGDKIHYLYLSNKINENNEILNLYEEDKSNLNHYTTKSIYMWNA